jgi:hypothetical protein
MTAGIAETCQMTDASSCSPQPTSIAAQYETLRMAALGEILPPEARSGLMLFLCRGMWGWARTLATQTVREELTTTPLPAGPQPTHVKRSSTYWRAW